MDFLLDTCVISDGAKPDKFPRLAEWLERQRPADFAIAALTVGELRYGVQRLPPGRRRESLKQWLDEELLPTFGDRILPVDESVASSWALLRMAAEQAGRPLPVIDGLLLATAQAHRLTFVTRNVADAENRGVSVLNPY